MTPVRLIAASLLAMSLVAGLAHAAPDTVLARNASVSITEAEFEQEMSRLPPELRADFLNAPRRVGELLTQMLARKTLAEQARAAKLDEKPDNRVKLAIENEKLLAQMRLAEVEARAAEDFEARKDATEKRAREIYVSDRERWRAPEQVSASHILFTTDKHSSDEAKGLAEAARAKLAAGADFSALAKAESEDPSAATNGGSLGYFPRDRMDPAFSEAAFALQKPGDLSAPVRSRFGWHVIRLDGRKPAAQRTFDEVKGEIVAELRKRFIDEQRDALLLRIRNDPANAIDESALNALAAKARAERPVGSGGAAGAPRQ